MDHSLDFSLDFSLDHNLDFNSFFRTELDLIKPVKIPLSVEWKYLFYILLHDNCGFTNRKQEICSEKKSDFLKVIMSGDSGEIDELLWDQIIGWFNILIESSDLLIFSGILNEIFVIEIISRLSDRRSRGIFLSNPCW